ncbi:APC family permease [Salinisphaera sp. USBA-960]|uniref:APC family permease n=1 Tax=Salinisphaera orenii TaxID=856731 RepID=UPI000DBE0B02|nr:APC family permease [Salifodinibacter halophilus]NNC26027.1 APC family permease [Salifodinibacter halophilus]
MSDQRNTLAKTFKPHWIWAMAFGSAVGWGSFVLPANWIAQAGPLGVIIGFAIGAAAMILIGVSTAYLIRAYPVTGGPFAYSYLCFGRNHAFICGWFLILGYASVVALNASAMGLMVKFLFPGFVKTGQLYSVAGWNIYLVQVLIVSGILILFAWLNYRGAGVSGRTQFLFCVLLLMAAVVVTIGMASSPSTTLSNLSPAFKPGIGSWSAIAGIVAIAPWAYVGFDTVPQTAEEFNFSPRKATTLIISALAIAAIHYSILIVATGLAMPWTDLAARHELWGTGYAVQSVLGYGGLSVLVVALTMGIFTGLNGFYISTSRLMFAMGRARAIPPMFARLHYNHNTPYNSIVFVCVISLVAPWFGRPVLLWIVNMSAIGVSIAYLYYCLAAYRLFRWHAGSPANGLNAEVAPFKKIVSLVGSGCSIGFLGLLLIPGSPGALGMPSWIVLAFWVALGVGFYTMYAGDYQNSSTEELDYLILGEQVSAQEDKTNYRTHTTRRAESASTWGKQ